MSKELEALKNIEKEIEDYEGFDENTYHQMDRTRFIIIETALYKLESLKKKEELLDYVMENKIPILKNLEQFQKKLKALEIIKEKDVNLHELRHYFKFDYNEYKKDFENGFNYEPKASMKLLTPEEFDLLKEVLL